jgi:small subunit ribosomal protein S21|tara:strand:- start:24027 stop:24239 length:213 start_codon:yes stop_codon:yes gene_type:complete
MKKVNVETKVKKDEHIDRVLKRFIKKVKKEQILEEFRDRMYYEKPSEKRNKLKKRIKALNKKMKQQEETN